MDWKQCRFCAVVPSPGCPKANNLTAQLIQYHYSEDFYFYFARSINELLRPGSNADKIMLEEARIQSSRPRLGMVMYSRRRASELIHKMYDKGKVEQKYQPCIANLSQWKFINDRKKKEKAKSTLHGETRMRRLAGRFPLRQGSLLGPILPQPGQQPQFVDPGSFSTTLHDIYDPRFSSEEEREEGLPANRKDSVFLEKVYDKHQKTKIPLLDIRKIISTQKLHVIETEVTEDKGSGTRTGVTGTYLFRPPSLTPAKNLLTSSRLQMSGPSISALEVSRSRVKNSTKNKSKTRRKPKEKIGLRLDLRGINIMDKRRGGSISSNGNLAAGMGSTSKIKGISLIQTARADKKAETKTSAADLGVAGLLSSRTAKGAPQTAQKESGKKVLDQFTSPKTRMTSHKSFRSGLGSSMASRPTLQLVKEQLAKLSGKDSIGLQKDKQLFLLPDPLLLKSRFPQEIQLSPKSKKSQERLVYTHRTLPQYSCQSMDIPSILKTIADQRTRDKSRNNPSNEKKLSTMGSHEKDRDKSKSKSARKVSLQSANTKVKNKRAKDLLKNIEMFARNPSRKTIKLKNTKS